MGDTAESGNFLGHFIPAVCFGGLGLFFLLLSLKRARFLKPGRSFCETHVPEKNIALLKCLGTSIILIMPLGIVFEGLGGCLTRYDDYHAEYCFFHQSAHMILYFSFGSVGPIMLLEGSGRLPSDSTRVATALAFTCAYILWNEHALMKDDPTDNRVHALLAQLNLVTASTFVLSVVFPKNLTLYIAGYGLMVLQGIYLLTAGVNAGIHKIGIQYVGPIFCFEVVVVTLVIVLVGAFCGSGLKSNAQDTASGSLNGSMSNGYLHGRSRTGAPHYDRLKIADDDTGRGEVDDVDDPAMNVM